MSSGPIPTLYVGAKCWRWTEPSPSLDEALTKLEHMRFAWLSVIQGENSCTITGHPCTAKRCGCAAEQDMLLKEFAP